MHIKKLFRKSGEFQEGMWTVRKDPNCIINMYDALVEAGGRKGADLGNLGRQWNLSD